VVATLLRFADRITAPPPGPEVTASDEHRALAREVAARSLVLLRNEPVPHDGAEDRAVLPLDRDAVGRLAVVGRLADQATLGDHGSSRVRPPSVVTALDGLRAALPKAELTHVATDVEAAVAAAAGADVAVVVVGLDQTDEGEFLDADATAKLAHLFPPRPSGERPAPSPAGSTEPAAPAEPAIPTAPPEMFPPGGDRRSLALRDEDVALIEAVAAANPRTVVVLIGGSALLVDPWHERVAAIVHAFYPGMEGGHALADLLLGDVEPSGRLPFAVPTDPAHLPELDVDASAVTYDAWHGQWKLHRDDHPARYPFGFGLGYGAAEITGAAVRLDEGAIEVTATLANAGDRSQAEVVQVYAGGAPGGLERPRRRLVAFARVVVPPAGTTLVRLEVPVERLAVWSDGGWTVEGGRYPLAIALHADHPGVTTAVNV
jgi:beta-glucosidase